MAKAVDSAELRSFLTMVWNILSNGAIVAAISMLLPRIFKKVKRKQKDDEE